MSDEKRQKISEFMGKEVYILQVGGFFLLFVFMLFLFVASQKSLLQTQAKLDNIKDRAQEAYEMYKEYKTKNDSVEAEYDALQQKFAVIASALGQEGADMDKILKGIESLQHDVDKLRDVLNQPPVIQLTSSKGYTFPTAKMEISTEFKERLDKEVVPQMLENSLKFGTDLVVVSGHTDEVPMYEGGGKNSLFDQEIFAYLNGKKKELHPVSNVELGFGRALSVVLYLSNKPQLSHLKIIPYSGGQLITKQNEIVKKGGGASIDRRRIEISLQRSHLN